MKYIFSLVVAILATTAVVNAADPVIAPVCPTCGPGGSIAAFNYTTNRIEMWPQCFPYVWHSQWQAGNISDMYKNQNSCRSARLVDFRR